MNPNSLHDLFSSPVITQTLQNYDLDLEFTIKLHTYRQHQTFEAWPIGQMAYCAFQTKQKYFYMKKWNINHMESCIMMQTWKGK